MWSVPVAWSDTEKTFRCRGKFLPLFRQEQRWGWKQLFILPKEEQPAASQWKHRPSEDKLLRGWTGLPRKIQALRGPTCLSLDRVACGVSSLPAFWVLTQNITCVGFQGAPVSLLVGPASFDAWCSKDSSPPCLRPLPHSFHGEVWGLPVMLFSLHNSKWLFWSFPACPFL